MKALLTGITVLLLHFNSYSQVDTGFSIYSWLDTIETTNVGLRAETGPTYARFYVNGRLVDKRTYDSYLYLSDNISKCNPCFLKVYDEEDVLVRTAQQYSDCAIGSWTEYYPNGKVKVEGQFKRNGTGRWEDLYYQNLCSIKEGTWKYYDDKGKLVRVETYKDGTLMN